MERNLLHAAEHGQQAREHPPIERRMRESAQIDRAAAKDVVDVIGVERLDQRVRRLGEVYRVVALDSLVKKGQAQQ
ncbi:MAG: hypothetical protein WDO73_37575 [Ignavibacteriota bacterium]